MIYDARWIVFALITLLILGFKEIVELRLV